MSDASGRLLVTGAAGFVGGRVLKGLADDGWTVAAVVREGTDASRLDHRAEVLRHDGTTEGLAALVASFCPDAVVHAASRFVAEHQPRDLDGLIESNLHFGCQLLDAMSRGSVDALVDFGTSWQHFDVQGVGGDAYHPVSLYAATKQAFQDLVRFYAEARGLRAVTLKLSDTYGPDDPRPKVVALFKRISADGQALAMSGGEQSFNLVHVDDVVEAVRIALARARAAPAGVCEAFSVRGSEMMTLRSFADLFQDVTGRTLDIDWGARPYRDREVMHAWQGERLPGWAARISLREGLAEVVKDV